MPAPPVAISQRLVALNAISVLVRPFVAAVIASESDIDATSVEKTSSSRSP